MVARSAAHGNARTAPRGRDPRVDDDNTGNLMLLPGKATLEGECFQQNCEAEPRRAALVGQQLEFVRAESPMVCQLITRPLPLHRGAPSVRRRVRRPATSRSLSSRQQRAVGKVPRIIGVGTSWPSLAVVHQWLSLAGSTRAWLCRSRVPTPAGDSALLRRRLYAGHDSVISGIFY
jgi:hypothetical protein